MIFGATYDRIPPQRRVAEPMKRLWDAGPVRFVRDMAGIYFEKRADVAAAGLTYFLILSFFPLLICINAAVGALRLDALAILRALSAFLAPSLLEIVSDYLGYITTVDSPGLLAAGALTTLFFASGAMRTLMGVMDDIYGRKGRSGLARVLTSVAFSLLLLVAIDLSLVVVLTGGWFFRLLERYLPFAWLARVLSWQWLKYVCLFGVVFLLVTAVYLMSAPPGKPRAPVFRGALLASAALVVASWVFSLFISFSSRYSLIYGSLASIFILLLWLYLCANVLILGNVFNCVRYTRKKEKKLLENA